MSSGSPAQGRSNNNSCNNSSNSACNSETSNNEAAPTAVVRRNSSGGCSSQSPVAAATVVAATSGAGATGTTTTAQSTSSSSSSSSSGDPVTATLARMTADLPEDSQVALHHDHRLPSSSRVMRNMAEKMRRDKLNNYITELATIVPLVSGANKRIDKTSVLRLAANYIRLNRILKEDDEEESPSTVNAFDAQTSQQFMDVADGFLLLVTSTGKVVYVTDAIETSFGHSKVDLLGNNIYSIIHPDDVDIFQQQLTPKGSSRRSFYCRMMEKALSRNDPGRYEIIHVVGSLAPIPQGFKNFLPTGNSPVKDEPASPITEKGDDDTDSVDEENEAMQMTNREGTHILKGFVRVVKDRPITELSLMESIQDEYITRHRMDGRILYTDHRISFVTGLMPGEVLGSSAFSYMHADDMLWSIVAQKHMFSSSQGQGIVSYRLQCRDGKYITLRSRGFLEVNKQSGQVDTFVCINTVLSICESESEIKAQRRKLLPMISCQESENFLSSISSSLPTELYELLKPILNAETVQRMIASIDQDLDTATDTKLDIPSVNSNNYISDSSESKERWQNDCWEEINPNHPPPKSLPSSGKIKEVMKAEDPISANQWYSTNPKKRNQDEKNYYPPNKKLNTLNSHSEPYPSYSHGESHKQNYSMDVQTYCQQNLSYQHDGTQMPSDHPVPSQKKRFCPDNIDLRNSFQPKSPSINCSITSPLDTSSPMSVGSYSTYTDDDQSSLCSAQSPSGIQSPMSVESCISTIFGSPAASMCSNFDGTPDSNMENNRYSGSSESSIGNNSFAKTNVSSTVSGSKSYNGTNSSNFEMVGLADSTMSSPECISPSICSGQQQLTLNRPSIAQVRSPGGIVCSPGGIVQSPGLSSPADINSMSSISPVFFQSQSSLPDQNFNSTKNYSFKKPHDKSQKILQTSYQTPRRFHQEMIRNTGNGNSFQSDGNGQLLIPRDQETHEHYNLQNSRLGHPVEQPGYFHHQYTPENKQLVGDKRKNTCSVEQYTVTEGGEQGNNTLYPNSLSCNVEPSRGPPPPIPGHPMQPPEAPRYNTQQQQQQQQQHIGQNL